MSDKKTLKGQGRARSAPASSRTATRCAAGLRRSTASALEDTPAVRGMINKIAYLVKVL